MTKAEFITAVEAKKGFVSIIQDELGHAHIAYRMLEDLGVSKEKLVYKRSSSGLITFSHLLMVEEKFHNVLIGCAPVNSSPFARRIP